MLRKHQLEAALRDCHRRISEGVSLQDCLDVYPQFATPIEAHFDLMRSLTSANVTNPPARVTRNGRGIVLAAVAAGPAKEKPMFASPISKIAAGLIAGFVLGSMTLGAGAATETVEVGGPVGDLLTNLGVQDRMPEHVKEKLQNLPGGPDGVGAIGAQQTQGEHGMNVRDAVMNALNTYKSQYTGPDSQPGLGRLVGRAACEAAHNRADLPEKASSIEPQNQHACGAPEGEVGGAGASEDQNGGPPANKLPVDTPGQGPQGAGGASEEHGPPANTPPVQTPDARGGAR
jgi:hypothetical protein